MWGDLWNQGGGGGVGGCIKSKGAWEMLRGEGGQKVILKKGVRIERNRGLVEQE